MTTTARRDLQSIQRKLDRWELGHLREHAAELARQLEAAQQELAETKRQLSWAEDCAERWRQDVLDTQEALASDEGASHRAIGITKDGSLVVVQLQ